MNKNFCLPQNKNFTLSSHRFLFTDNEVSLRVYFALVIHVKIKL